jgi:DNA/RNA-binding domain of Phe-tRNA-synthetase-like protein
MALAFQYHPEIVARFPNICGGVILVPKIAVQPSPPELQEIFFSEQQAVKEHIGAIPLSEIASVAAWRGAFRSFGVDPTAYRSACEALLRRLTKKGDIPSINTLVDICNLVSIRYALPVAAFNVQALQGPITVRFAQGSERYTPLDGNTIENPLSGEVIFCDDCGLVVARRWCWKQSLESATGFDTQQAVLTVEAQHPGGRGDIQAAIDDLELLLGKYSSGRFISGIVDASQPSFVFEPGDGT